MSERVSAGGRTIVSPGVAASIAPRDWLCREPSVQEAFERNGLNSCAAVVAFFTGVKPVPAGVLVKPAVLPLHDGSTLPVFYKQYEYPAASWRFLGRASKARREFDNYAVFAGLNVPCIERLAVGEMRDSLGRLLRAFILTRTLPAARTMTDFVEQECPAPRGGEAQALRLGLLRQLATTTRRVHEAGFFHNDLYWRNLLVTWERPAPPRIWWIDCPRGGFARFRRTHRRIKDLACLDKAAVRLCSRAERIAFVREYLALPALNPDVLKWAHAVRNYRVRRWRDSPGASDQPGADPDAATVV